MCNENVVIEERIVYKHVGWSYTYEGWGLLLVFMELIKRNRIELGVNWFTKRFCNGDTHYYKLVKWNSEFVCSCMIKQKSDYLYGVRWGVFRTYLLYCWTKSWRKPGKESGTRKFNGIVARLMRVVAMDWDRGFSPADGWIEAWLLKIEVLLMAEERRNLSNGFLYF